MHRPRGGGRSGASQEQPGGQWGRSGEREGQCEEGTPSGCWVQAAIVRTFPGFSSEVGDVAGLSADLFLTRLTLVAAGVPENR